MERLVAELSHRVWDLERNRNYRFYPTYVGGYSGAPLFYSSTGLTTNLASNGPSTLTSTDTGNAES